MARSQEDVYDVIVVGGGNAGFSAASTAAQTLRSSNTAHPKVLLLEKSSRDTAGGNTFYTAGAYRFCFESLDDLRPLLSVDGKPGIPDELAARIEMAPYREVDFRGDLERVTSGRADPALAEVLVGRSREAVDWMCENGGRWELSFHRQAYEVDGRYKFWGGLVVCFAGGGKGLVKWHQQFAEREGVEVRYGAAVVDLVVDESASGSGTRVVGVEIEFEGRRQRLLARGGVVLAAGGFQANPSLRAQWLGPSWSAAHVRGSATNTGDGHDMTLLSPQRRVRAKRAGHYAGCHSVCWDVSSPAGGGDRVLTNQYTKSGYPLGIMVNLNGQRFVDEGADLRNYTYAIFGREVLKQPDGVAWQIWDAEGRKLLRGEEYDASVTDLIMAGSLKELAKKLAGSGLKDEEAFVETMNTYNSACLAFEEENPDVKFDPASRDSLSTQSSKGGLSLPKSNWARPIVKAPFTAVKITCGVTFTFGGLAVVPETAEVCGESDDENERESDIQGSSNTTTGEKSSTNSRSKTIEGLYCTGELLGGLFWDNYPGGSGLTAGTVFGRIAGQHAAQRAMKAS